MQNGVESLYCKWTLGSTFPACAASSVLSSYRSPTRVFELNQNLYIWQAGPYLRDVKIAVNAAADYFDNVENVSRSQVVVFDIDETALSHLPVRPSCCLQPLILLMPILGGLTWFCL